MSCSIAYDPGCLLCHLWHDREIVTKFYYEDTLVIIVDCQGCKAKAPQLDHPMGVIKRHDRVATEQEKRHAGEIVQRLWPGCVVHWGLRKIKDHIHFHVKPAR